MVGLIVAVEAISIGAFSLGQNRTLLRYAGEVPQPRDALVTGLAISTTCLIAAAVLFITVASGTSFWVQLGGFKTALVLLPAVLLVQTQELQWAWLRALNDAAAFRTAQGVYFVAKAVAVGGTAFVLRSSLAYPVGVLIAGSLSAGAAYLSNPGFRHGRFRRDLAVKFVAFGWPFTFHGLGGTALMFADRFILARLGGIADVAVLSLGVSIASAIPFTYGALGLWFEPYLYRVARSEAASTVDEKLFLFSLVQFCVGALVASAIVIALGLLGPAKALQGYPGAVGVTTAIAAGYAMQPAYLFGHYRILLAGRSTGLVGVTLAAASANIVGNFLLVPSMGVRGAAIAKVASLLVLSGVMVAWAHRLRRIDSAAVLLLGAATVGTGAVALSSIGARGSTVVGYLVGLVIVVGTLAACRWRRIGKNAGF